MLSERIRAIRKSGHATLDPDSLSLPKAVEQLERRMIATALERNRGNKTRAAAELQVSRRNLIRLVQKHKLDG
jgi:transcriptional regulator with PAS, ATPase and Fis domain